MLCLFYTFWYIKTFPCKFGLFNLWVTTCWSILVQSHGWEKVVLGSWLLTNRKTIPINNYTYIRPWYFMKSANQNASFVLTLDCDKIATYYNKIEYWVFIEYWYTKRFFFIFLRCKVWRIYRRCDSICLLQI